MKYLLFALAVTAIYVQAEELMVCKGRANFSFDAETARHAPAPNGGSVCLYVTDTEGVVRKVCFNDPTGAGAPTKCEPAEASE
jgi:hypothetical protein